MVYFIIELVRALLIGSRGGHQRHRLQYAYKLYTGLTFTWLHLVIGSSIFFPGRELNLEQCLFVNL